MKVTAELRKAINAGVRGLCGANPLAEVGIRESADGKWYPNGLTWVRDADLGDMVRLADLKQINEDPTLPGCATLDLYVTSGVGSDRELECNVYVTIKDGKLVDMHNNGLRADARTRAILGRPFSAETVNADDAADGGAL